MSRGYNKDKTHTKATSKFNKIHAEVDALLCARRPIKGCNAYVYRETKRGDVALAKPCTFCEESLRRAGIQKVFYTTTAGFECLELAA